MKNIILTLFIIFSSTTFAQENIDLFIWAGQSNALGRKGDAANYPVDTNNLDSQIRFNWIVPNGSNSNGWVTMGPQDLGHYFPDGHFGAEVSFSRKLVQAGYNPAIFKFAQGATSIYEHWLNPGQGGLYDNMVTALNTAIADLQNQGHTVTIKGFIWIQGESDSNSAAAADAYFNNLTSLLTDLRNNVVGNPNLPVILGVDEQYFNIPGHEFHQILNAHQDIALNDNTIKFTSMYGYPKADVTHLTPAGLISQGEDLFDSYELLISGQNPLENCTLTSLGNHNSFERKSWGQSFTTDCSGILSTITFEATTTLNSSATFSIYNGADCSGTVLATKSLSSIQTGNNIVDLSGEGLYLDKEHTYYFDIVSDDGTTWKIDFSNVDKVFGVLRCFSDDTTENCGRTFLDYDMDFSVTTSGSECVDITNIYAFNYDGRTYEIVKEPKSWEAAAACAVARGGKLARVNDAAEQSAIWNELNNNANIDLSTTVASNGGGASYVWIGGNDIASEGTWIWDGDNDGIGEQFWNGDTNGNPIDGLYSNWGTEPDNSGNQDALAIALTQWPVNTGSLGSAGQWNDLKAADPLYFIIEYPSILSVDESNLKNTLLYPIPVNDILSIFSKNKITDVILINSIGQVIDIIKIPSQDKPIQINFSEIQSGIYFIRIRFENGQFMTKKILK